MNDPWELFSSGGHRAAARVYARWQGPTPPGATIAGRVVGPYSRQAHTLTASFPLVDRGPGPTPLAEALVTDPCFWTPETPCWYRAELALVVEGVDVERHEKLVGLRALGVRGRSFVLDGTTWVPRIVSRAIVEPTGAPWRDTVSVEGRAMTELDGLQTATEAGWMQFVFASVADQLTSVQVRRPVAWPSVAALIVPVGSVEPATLRPALTGALLGIEVHGIDELPQATGGDFFVVANDDLEQHVAVAMMTTRPVVSCRSTSTRGDLVAARAECDRLQRDLAGRGDFAGYMVRA